MWKAPANKEDTKAGSGIEVSLQELIQLRHTSKQKTLDGYSKSLNISGLRLSCIRGRGIEFDTTREYQPGDDIRNMAWRVTARSLKPHIKVYREEQERPVWLAIDLSPSLYFGTRCMFKSVKIIKQAVILGWSHLSNQERIGALIGAEENTLIHRPQSSERHYMGILNALAECSRSHPRFSDSNYLHSLLLKLQHQVRSGNLVFILSDFFQFDEANQKLILQIAQRAQVVLFYVYDIFEAYPPPPHKYFLTNGQKNIIFNMDDVKIRQDYSQQFQIKLNQITDFARKHNIALQILQTNEQ